jgi:hypothetical protein
MNVTHIREHLNSLGIEHFVDSYNPSHTIHLMNDDLIDADDVSGPWKLYSDRHNHSMSKIHDISSLSDITALSLRDTRKTPHEIYTNYNLRLGQLW